ncbi:MAG: hypothetical protein V3S30_05150 [Thermoanaerobaculia bacterium]
MSGEVDSAFEWLERAYDQRDAGLSEMKGEPFLSTDTAPSEGSALTARKLYEMKSITNSSRVHEICTKFSRGHLPRA